MVQLTVKQTGTAVPNKVYIGSTHVPIQAAIDYAHSKGGGTIFIEHGTYLINNTANTDANGKHGLKLYSNIKITGEYFGTILKPDWTDTAGSVVSCIGTAGNELENIVIEALLIGNDAKETAIGHYGIYCSYCGKAQTTGLADGGYDASTVGRDKVNKIGVRIRDCVTQGNKVYGISFNYSSNCMVTGNIVQECNGVGINFFASRNNIITENTTQNNGNSGINVNLSNNNTITGNTTQNNNGAGVYLGVSNNNTIIGNTTQNNNNDGISNNGSNNNTITGNTIQNNKQYGIALDNSSSNNAVFGNTMQNGGNIGIYLNVSNSNTVSGNTMQDNSSTAIYTNAASNNTITGNKYTSIKINTGTGNLNADTHNQQIA